MAEKINVKSLVQEFMSETKSVEQANNLLKGFEETRLTLLADFGKRLSNASPDDVSNVAGEIVKACHGLGEGHKRYIADGSMKSAKSDFTTYLNVGRKGKADAVNKATDKALKTLGEQGIERRRPNVYKAIARKIVADEKPLGVADAVNEYVETVTETESKKAKKVAEFSEMHEFQQIATTTKETLERLIKKHKVSEVDRKHFRPIMDALNDFLQPEMVETFAPKPAAPGSDANTAAADLASVVSAIDMNNPLVKLLLSAASQQK